MSYVLGIPQDFGVQSVERVSTTEGEADSPYTSLIAALYTRASHLHGVRSAPYPLFPVALDVQLKKGNINLSSAPY